MRRPILLASSWLRFPIQTNEPACSHLLWMIFFLCRHIGLLFGKRLDTIFRISGFAVHSLSDSLRIYFFHFGERIKKYPDSLPNSPDACGRKPYPERKHSAADSIISGYVYVDGDGPILEKWWRGGDSACRHFISDTFKCYSEAREWRHDSDKTQTNKLERWTILKISFRAKASIPKTLVKQKLRLHSLCFL